MGKEQNGEIEKTLREILTPDDGKTDPRTILRPSLNISDTPKIIEKKQAKKIPRWIEVMVRVIAAIVAALLLAILSVKFAFR